MIDSAADITAWIVGEIARELHLDPGTIDPARPLSVCGLDSLTAAGLAADLEDHLGRPVPQTLLGEDVSIQDIARALSTDDSPPVSPPDLSPSPSVDYAALDYSGWTRPQRILQGVTTGLTRALGRIEVSGIDEVPRTGPLIFASNHLHILDALWMFSILPRRTVFLVADEFRRRPIVGWLLGLGHSIFVKRGAGDRAAIDQALTVLGRGGAIAVAPEGRLSRTGGLIEALPGVARLGVEGGAAIVPVAMWGQEQLLRNWRHLRRVPIHVRFAAPVVLPRSATTAKQLEACTTTIMMALADALPADYRGVYSRPR